MLFLCQQVFFKYNPYKKTKEFEFSALHALKGECTQSTTVIINGLLELEM